MFTVEQIQNAHSKVKSGADFPSYIQEIKKFGVTAYETWVKDSHTQYFSVSDFSTASLPKYDELAITDEIDKEKFVGYLKSHQQGQTDYYTFCKHCAETGIEKWSVCLDKMTCTYYDKAGTEVLVENVPQ